MQPSRTTRSCTRQGGCTQGRRAAFTIVELMVTVSVIAVLMGLLFPAIHGARRAALRTNELVAAQQLMLGYIAYTNDHKDHVMPGYMTGLPAYDASGTPLEDLAIPAVAARYPWRIAPYLDYTFRGLYKNGQERVLEEMEYTAYDNYIYVVSLSPSLGLNTAWVGGDQNQLGFNPTALNAYGKFYATTLTEIFFPQRLMVFTSARGIDPLDPGAPMVEGYYRVQSPRFSESGGYTWTENYHEADTPADYGFVSLRYGGHAVSAFADGHVGTVGEKQVTDMRHWANRADSANWGLEPR